MCFERDMWGGGAGGWVLVVKRHNHRYFSYTCVTKWTEKKLLERDFYRLKRFSISQSNAYLSKPRGDPGI